MNLHQGLVVRFIRSISFKTFAKSTVHTMANSTINLAASKTRHTVYQIIGTYIPYATADFIESAMRDISADKATERLQAYIAAHPVVETTRMTKLLSHMQRHIDWMLAHPLLAIKQLEATTTSDMLDNVAHPVVETTRMTKLLSHMQRHIDWMLAHPLLAIKQLEATTTSDMLDNVMLYGNDTDQTSTCIGNLIAKFLFFHALTTRDIDTWVRQQGEDVNKSAMLYGNDTDQTSTCIGNLIAKFLFFHALTTRDIDTWVRQQGEDVNKSATDISIQNGIAYECAGVAIDTLLWGYDAALISAANEDASVDDILVTAINIWSMYYIDAEIHQQEDVEYLVAVLGAIKTDPENTDSPDSDTLIEHCNSVIARLNTWLDMQH